jgi:hypothetical protein
MKAGTSIGKQCVKINAPMQLIQQDITAIHHPGKDNITTTARCHVVCASSMKQKRHKMQNSIKKGGVRG